MIKKATFGNIWFDIFASIAVIMLIASWFVPPMAVIDASVLAGVGELFGFAALGTVIHAIDKGRSIEMTHGNTTMAVGNKDEDAEE